jgi:ACR3 family arsenite efflux pump ArsB
MMWAERRQVALYLASIVAGAAVGILIPSASGILASATTPVLGLLLYATFLGVPLAAIARALGDLRFLGTLLVVNFVAIPVIVFALSRVVAHDSAVLVGVLLVLLTPCVDYVIVFAGLAGGDRVRLLAATPVLVVLQMLLLPARRW